MGSCINSDQQQMSKRIQPNSNFNIRPYKSKAKQIPQNIQKFCQYDHLESYNNNNKYTDTHELGKPKPMKKEVKQSPPSSYKPRGIPNLGNTCYMNSVLQCLHKSKHFVNKFTKIMDTSSSKEGRQLSQSFLNFVYKMEYSDSPFSLQIQKIKELIASRNYIFDNYKQQDATQFYSTFLSIISQELNSPLNSQKDTKQTIMYHYIEKEVSEGQRKEIISEIYEDTIRMDLAYSRSVVDQTFTGRYQVTYTCEKCQADYILFQKFNIHYLQIPDKSSQNHKYTYKSCDLLECLKQFEQADRLEGEDRMTCDVCQGKSIQSCKLGAKQSSKRETNQSKIMQIYEANQIFVIGIKRFYKGYKNQTKVKLPSTLQPNQIMLNHKNSRYEGKHYKMYAAILHYGTLHSGHYVAYCLHQTTNTWVEYNDSTTRQLGSFKSIDFGNAYAVFYKLYDRRQTRQTEKDVNQRAGKLSPIKQSSYNDYRWQGYP